MLSDNYMDSFDQFPPNVSLDSLHTLDLHANKLQRSLPKVFCNVTQLHLFDVSFNNFTGQIPNCLGNNAALNYLDLQITFKEDCQIL